MINIKALLKLLLQASDLGLGNYSTFFLRYHKISFINLVKSLNNHQGNIW